MTGTALGLSKPMTKLIQPPSLTVTVPSAGSCSVVTSSSTIVGYTVTSARARRPGMRDEATSWKVSSPSTTSSSISGTENPTEVWPRPSRTLLGCR